MTLQNEAAKAACIPFTISLNGWPGRVGFAGIGNIDADPLFIGGEYYRPSVGSPVIDAGTAADVPKYDIIGTPRDAAPDMGAYEWTGFRTLLPLMLKDSGS